MSLKNKFFQTEIDLFAIGTELRKQLLEIHTYKLDLVLAERRYCHRRLEILQDKIFAIDLTYITSLGIILTYDRLISILGFHRYESVYALLCCHKRPPHSLTVMNVS